MKNNIKIKHAIMVILALCLVLSVVASMMNFEARNREWVGCESRLEGLRSLRPVSIPLKEWNEAVDYTIIIGEEIMFASEVTGTSKTLIYRRIHELNPVHDPLDSIRGIWDVYEMATRQTNLEKFVRGYRAQYPKSLQSHRP